MVVLLVADMERKTMRQQCNVPCGNSPIWGEGCLATVIRDGDCITVHLVHQQLVDAAATRCMGGTNIVKLMMQVLSQHVSTLLQPFQKTLHNLS